jgi:hypothetical protein
MENQKETTTVNSIQEIINKRAAATLKKDLLEISVFISSNPLLRTEVAGSFFVKKEIDTKPVPAVLDGNGQAVRMYPEGAFKEASIDSFFYCSKSYPDGINISGIQAQRIFNHWLPVYIERETQAFIESVDELKAQVSDLMNDKQD